MEEVPNRRPVSNELRHPMHRSRDPDDDISHMHNGSLSSRSPDPVLPCRYYTVLSVRQSHLYMSFPWQISFPESIHLKRRAMPQQPSLPIPQQKPPSSNNLTTTSVPPQPQPVSARVQGTGPTPRSTRPDTSARRSPCSPTRTTTATPRVSVCTARSSVR